MRFKSFIGLLSFFVLAVCVSSTAGHVSADIEDLTVSTGCSKLPSYTAVLNIQGGAYDVYTRLAKRGEKAKVATYTQTKTQSYGECDKIGEITATGDAWTKAGSLNVAEAQDYTLQLASTVLAQVPDANRPSIMLVPRVNNAVCEPTDECYVTISGERAYLRPIGTLLNQDSLRAMVVKDPSTDRVQKVRYYADGRLVYATPALEPFDERYIEYGGQDLTRVVTYESGQQAVIDTRSPLTFQGSFGNFLFRGIERYPNVISFLLWSGIVLLVSCLLLIFLRILRRRQDDRIHHGFAKERQLNFFEHVIYFLQARRSIKIVRLVALGGIIIAGMAALIVLTSSYALQIITVDGHSMEKSYFTDDRVIVSKVSKTLASLNGREYVPKRGQVVIVRASFGNAVLSGEDNTNLTLIKRVIALPGERVVIRQGTLTVYNDKNPDGFLPDSGSSWEKQMTRDKKTENIDITLGPSELFVSGDNRPASIDSRFNGPIATKEIIGLVIGKM